jgi:hypothetical protein
LLTPKLYRYHNYRVLDADDREVGRVDWIWADEASGAGRHIGIRLQWLRGRAQAIPAHGIQVEPHTSTIRVPYLEADIRRAPRYAIDRTLTAWQERAIRAHYGSQSDAGQAEGLSRSVIAA